MPLLSGWAIDEISKGAGASIKYVVLLATGIFILDVLGTIFSNIGGYYGDIMATKLQKLLASRYYQHLLQLPQYYFDKELSGKIINRLNRSINDITRFMHVMSNNFLQFIFTTVFSLIIIAYYSWQVALLLFALYPIYILLTLRTSDKWMKYQTKQNTQEDIATGRFAEAINQMKVVKSFVQQGRELSFFNKHMQKMVDINKPQSAYWHKRDIERRLVLNVIFFGVYLFIFVQGVNGLYSPGVAVALILYAMQIRIPIFTISFLVDSTQRAVANSKDYFEILDVEPESSTNSHVSLNVNKGHITFDDVRFGYDDEAVLKGITFDAKPGEKVALVGESGEGKTTIANLLIGLYSPKSGQISIDGQDITDVSGASLKGNIAVVFQDPALFSGTILENISYASPNATKEQIIKAAKAANADEFIEKFEKGYESEIGERGLKLSGGQKQRIAIARAILKDSPILLLDEATSSLDNRSEILVHEALNELMHGRTTVIIAHRLSTIAHVDKIVTIQNGRVDEIGAPSELSKTGGIYASLLNISQQHSIKSENRLKSYDIAE